MKKQTTEKTLSTKAKTSREKVSEKTTPMVAPMPKQVIEDDYSLKTAELDFTTEVYDEGEIASALEMGFIAKSLALHQLKVAPEKHPDFDGESCIDCGDTIPQVRLDMGRIRCVYCQTDLEKKNKQNGIG